MRVAIPPSMRVLAIEHKETHYQVWIHPDKNFYYGTYLNLYPNGRIERVTERPDNTRDVFLVAQGDEL